MNRQDYADMLGSIIVITDTSGNTVQTYSYDSYGNALISNSSFAQPYLYTGREWDGETGLYYYRARYYEPTLGVFITKDPIGFKGEGVNLYRYVDSVGKPSSIETNLYRYAAGNPVNLTDPMGLEPGGGPNASIEPLPQPKPSDSWWDVGNNRATCYMRAHWEWELCLRGNSRDYDSCPQTSKDNCFTRVQFRLDECLRNAK